ncbi:MAG: ABC transporter ATP-binding protein [Alphaproteobacteria bacterium]|nr:ABC transporter ATP-binding protein [Alphaproteobacteria bacterium]
MQTTDPAAPAPRPLVSIRGLHVTLPRGAERRHAVEAVGFDLHAGEILCVVGESGSGKSLTAAALMRLLPRGVAVTQGTIDVDGTDLLALSEEAMRDWRGRRLGMIFQEPMTALNPIMKVGAQIDEVLRVHSDLDAAARGRRVIELMDAVGLPTPHLLKDSYPFRLSGGQRQRIMIAMALALEPRVLIADEPTTALDVTTQKQILALIRDLQARTGMAVLFITHDFGVVAEIAHRVVVMQEGRIVEQGLAAEVLERPSHPYTRKLIAAVPRLETHDRAIAAAPAPLLSVRNLSKAYVSAGGLFTRGRRVRAVNDVSFDIAPGETLGVVGESGSGKSTLGRLVIRLLERDGGEIRFDGADFGAARGRALHASRRMIQMVFQDPYASLNPRKRVGRLVADGPIAYGEPRDAAMDRARELLRLVGLDAAAVDRYPHEFSGGQRQRIAIARALALEPRLLIADEPVSALDVSVQAQVLELFNEIRTRLGLAMLFITHDLRVAANVADRIAVMRAGEIVELDAAERVFASPRHPYTRDLLDAIPGRERLAARA